MTYTVDKTTDEFGRTRYHVADESGDWIGPAHDTSTGAWRAAAELEGQRLPYGAMRRATGRIASRVLREHPDETLNTLMRLVMSEAGDTIDLSYTHVEAAIKARITIGRCRVCDMAYWFPKTQGRLADHRCPYCGHWLNQTTLALQKPFYRLKGH
jgi:hypothetical protein